MAGVAAGVGAVLAVRVLALAAHVVALKLDGELKLGISGGRVLEDGEPRGTVAVADTKVHGSEVAPGVGIRAPLASILHGDTGGVDVVLSAGLAALPVVVVVGIGAGQGVSLAGLGVERDGLALSTGVVSAANSDVLAKLVLNLDLDLGSARHAELGGHLLVSQTKLATLALNATNGLASGALVLGPLRHLVASGASVGAVGTLVAALASESGLDGGETSGVAARLLDASPTTKTHPVNRDGTVVLGEVAAVELTVREVLVDAVAGVVVIVIVVAVVRAVGRRSSLGGRRRSVRRGSSLGGARSRGHDSRGRRKHDGGGRLNVNGNAAGAGGGVLRLAVGSEGAGGRSRGKLAVAGHDEGTVLDALLNLILGDHAAVKLINDDGGARDADDVNGSRLLALGVVKVLVVVTVLVSRLSGGGDGGAEDSDNCVLHGGRDGEFLARQWQW